MDNVVETNMARNKRDGQQMTESHQLRSSRI